MPNKSVASLALQNFYICAMLRWETLLSATRYGHPADPDPNRSDYHRDYDRIVFSTAFRRLGRKTQVHPFSVNDHVHSRLTHSIEVSSVGRSLAITVFHLIKKYLPKYINEYQFGTIVQSACLAHDIGNPPFGHAGEAAIREWFRKNRQSAPLKDLSDKEMADFENFDGNAQGHRILSKLEYHFLDGGMRLTYATIGAMIKYPQLAKYGCPTSLFSTEADLYGITAETLGLPQIDNGKWVRHPLVYLMEAADDICYSILDVEDAIELGILSFGDVRDMFSYLCGPEINIDKEYEENGRNFRDFLSSIRGKAFQNIIDDVAVTFVKHYEEIMEGKLNSHLIDITKSDAMWGIRIAKRLGVERIYPDRRKTELEVGSYTTLATVLDAFINGVYDYRQNGRNSYRADRIVRLIGQAKIGQSVTAAEAYHQVLDFVTGMTDNYATYLARQIGGLAMGV
ncbi:dGTPase [Fibrobacter sp. UWT3]|nr:dGTPase [Fibrobacter sp. UWT3]